MEKWIENGVRLGWLVSPRDQQTYVYRPAHPVTTISFADTSTSSPVLVSAKEIVLADILEL